MIGWGNPGGWTTLRCLVANQGNARAEPDITMDVTVRFLLFGILPLGIGHDYSDVTVLSGLEPGHAVWFDFASRDIFPPRGFGIFSFWRVHCVVNPDRTIPESNYQNNYYARTVLMRFMRPNFI